MSVDLVVGRSRLADRPAAGWARVLFVQPGLDTVGVELVTASIQSKYKYRVSSVACTGFLPGGCARQQKMLTPSP